MKLTDIPPNLGSQSPAPLLHQCFDGIFTLVSEIISKYGFQNAIDYTKSILSELPRECQTLLLKTAEKNLDFTHSVRSLLLIWISCVQNGQFDEIYTPKYLYNDDEARKCVLELLGQYNSCTKGKVGIRQLSFQMYNFYSHLCQVRNCHKSVFKFHIEGNY